MLSFNTVLKIGLQFCRSVIPGLLLTTLYNVCVVQPGMFSTSGDITSTVGDIMSTLGGVQYTWGIS